jgi:branched-chain amino acid transport system substrate-binding protein
VHTSERGSVRPRARRVAPLVALLLLTSACGIGSDEDRDADVASEPIQVDESLGVVRLAPGETIQLRSIVGTAGDGEGGDPALDAMVDVALRVALEDFGGIQGFRVELGEPIAVDCTSAGGTAAAAAVLERPDVIGVFGPTCLASLITATSPLTRAGVIVVSPTATAPELTQSPFGEAGVNGSAGFLRTAPNALAEALAAATFATVELGLQRAVTIEDGSARAAGLAATFRTEFELLGGTVVRSSVLSPAADLAVELAAIVATEPDIVFLPLDPTRLLAVLEQWSETEGSSAAVRVATSLGLGPELLADPLTEDLYLTGGWSDFADVQSSVTGMGSEQALERVSSTLGTDSVDSRWAHAYDAMSLLLRAIDDASLIDVDGTLVISRADLRRALLSPGFLGMTGPVECDAFGDCGNRRSVLRLREGEPADSFDELALAFDTGP